MKKNEIALNSTENQNNSLEIKTVSNNELATINLNNATVLPIDLISGYWTPKAINESKRVIYQKVEVIQTLDMKTGAIIDLPCAFFLTPEDKKLTSIRNGSSLLVSAVENLPVNTPLLITYLGKKATRKGNQMDNWSILPLIINE